MTARYGQLANFFMKMSDLVLMLAALALAIVINYAPAERGDRPCLRGRFPLHQNKTRKRVAGGLVIRRLVHHF